MSDENPDVPMSDLPKNYAVGEASTAEQVPRTSMARPYCTPARRVHIGEWQTSRKQLYEVASNNGRQPDANEPW